MRKELVTTREDYDILLSKGIDCLYDPRFDLEIGNCGKPIRYPWATNVSHILTRGAHPSLAHDPRNINILCAECHSAWEHTTTRYKLRLWFVEKNERTIEELKREYYGIE